VGKGFEKSFSEDLEKSRKTLGERCRIKIISNNKKK
jgi:hypothetical protein